MAFVTRSERKFSLNPKETFSVGPGQYLKLPKLKDNIKQEKSNPKSLYPRLLNQVDEITPGPGSYNINYSSFNNNSTLNNLNNSNTLEKSIKLNNSNISTIDQSMMNHPKSKEKLGFLTKVERFPDSNRTQIKSQAHGSKNGSSLNYSNDLRKTSDEIKKELSSTILVSNNSTNYGTNLISKNNISNPIAGVIAPVPGFQTNSLKRVVSIPSKTMNGYYLDYKNNKSELIVDPSSLEKFKGETSSLVGPGSYEVDKKDKKNKAIDWNKTHFVKNFKIKKIKDIQNNIIHDLKQNDEIYKNQLKEEMFRSNSMKNFTISNYKNTTNSFYNIMQLKQLHSLKDFYKTTNICDYQFIMGNLNNTTPGPGYYGKDLLAAVNLQSPNLDEFINNEETYRNNPFIQEKIKRNMQKEKIKFGSSTIRFIERSNSYDNLGPAAYFQDKNKYEEKEKNKRDMNYLSHFNHQNLTKKIENNKNDFYVANGFEMVPFTIGKSGKNNVMVKSSSTTCVSSDQLNKKSVGPGDYNISQDILKPSTGNVGLLHSGEKRFFTNKINDAVNNPGPGTYMKNIMNEKSQSNNLWQNQMKDSSYKKIYEKLEEEEQVLEKIFNNQSRRKDCVPGVGTYSPGIIGSISYKNSMKMNPVQSKNSGFLQSSNRFQIYDKNVNPVVSPASYNPNKNVKSEFNKESPMFGVKQKRFMPYKDQIAAGVGDYNLDKNNWNKKTYNVLFLGNS